MTIKVYKKHYPFNAYAVKCWSVENDHLTIEFNDKSEPLKIHIQKGDEADILDALDTKFKLHFLQS